MTTSNPSTLSQVTHFIVLYEVVPPDTSQISIIQQKYWPEGSGYSEVRSVAHNDSNGLSKHDEPSKYFHGRPLVLDKLAPPQPLELHHNADAQHTEGEELNSGMDPFIDALIIEIKYTNYISINFKPRTFFIMKQRRNLFNFTTIHEQTLSFSSRKPVGR